MRHVDPALSDRDRWPLMTPEGRRLLSRLLEHPRAPRFNHACGDRLTAQMLEEVREREAALAKARWWSPGESPAWIDELVERARREVPFYRARPAFSFPDARPCDRGDLNREAWAFVPDSAPLDELIVYDTSGTTGQPIKVPSHPIVSTLFLPLLKRALGQRGVTLEGGAGRVSILLICAQQSTWTFPSISSYLDAAAYVKINLNPVDWRDPADRAAYIDDCAAEIWSGDPLSFLELMNLPLNSRPKALVSTALALAPGLAKELEAHFGCPVVDLYSMNECRAIASATVVGQALVAPDVYVEILGADGRVIAPGEHGEIAVTSGRNPCLPLIRYRTGDFGRLVDGLEDVARGRPQGTTPTEACLAVSNDSVPARPVIADFTGRASVVFLDDNGDLVNSIDAGLALRTLPIAEFSLRQDADRALELRFRGRVSEDLLRDRIAGVFGSLSLSIVDETKAPPPVGKRLTYASAYAEIWKNRPRRSWGRPLSGGTT